MNYLRNIFKGRLSLGNFWIGLILPTIICIPIGFIPGIESGYSSVFFNLIGTLLLFTLSIYFFSLILRRLHDTGKSGWFGLGVYLPIFGLYVLYLILLGDSQEKENKYGPIPNKKISFKNILNI